MIEIIPTNTCPPDFSELARRSELFSAFAPTIQLDLDDGVFAPVVSWPYNNGQSEEVETMAKGGEKLPFSGTMKYEAHLMVQEPVRIGELLAQMGCARILAHREVFTDAQAIKSAFSKWRDASAAEFGLALLIDTPLSSLDGCVADCDVVQLMSIPTLGKQGAPYDERVISRIEELHKRNPELMIAVDGGVSEKNIADLVRAGARRFGIGSAISKATNPADAYTRIKALAESAIV